MDLLLKYVLSPLLAAIFVNGFVWLKDRKTDQAKHLEGITFEQLTKVYNKLFILYSKKYSLLVIESGEEIYTFGADDELFYSQKVESIEVPKVWDEVINEVKDIVFPNIHLLTRNDIIIWNEFLDYEQIEPEHEQDVYVTYKKFHEFFKETSLSYVKLYNKYHKEEKSVKRTRKKRLKEKIKKIKNNGLLPKELKKKKIEEAKQKDKETKNRIL